MKKAVINKSTNEVENIIEYADRGVAIRLPLGYIVYDCTNVEVQIGDTFEDGVFYRNGEPVDTQLTDAQRLAQMEAAFAALAGEQGGLTYDRHCSSYATASRGVDGFCEIRSRCTSIQISLSL